MTCFSPARLGGASVVLLVVWATAPASPLAQMGVIIERASGQIALVDTHQRIRLATVSGLGDLSHASVVYSPDQRYAFIFGRDGGLSKVDLKRRQIVKRIRQAGNSIGGAISKDGKIVAVSNYQPGGVNLFDADSLALLAEIPTTYGADGQRSKVVGLVDAPGDRFVFSLYEAGEIWIADVRQPTAPRITKFAQIGAFPYDGLITPDGRFYVAGLFGEDGMALVDLTNPTAARRILPDYGRGQRKLPVYKMPHLEGWAVAGARIYFPAVGGHELLVADRNHWQLVDRISVVGQPVFAMARPDGKQVWVNFAPPHNDTVQIIDTETQRIIHTLKPGKAVLHMEFVGAGEEVWLSVRDEDRVDVFDTRSLQRISTISALHPSGIFFSSRAHRIGL